MSDQVSETPLQDLLRKVPVDQMLDIEVKESNGWTESRHIPVGHHCHKAATQIDALQHWMREFGNDAQTIWTLARAFGIKDCEKKTITQICFEVIEIRRAELDAREALASTEKGEMSVAEECDASTDEQMRLVAEYEMGNHHAESQEKPVECLKAFEDWREMRLKSAEAWPSIKEAFTAGWRLFKHYEPRYCGEKLAPSPTPSSSTPVTPKEMGKSSEVLTQEKVSKSLCPTCDGREWIANPTTYSGMSPCPDCPDYTPRNKI